MILLRHVIEMILGAVITIWQLKTEAAGVFFHAVYITNFLV